MRRRSIGILLLVTGIPICVWMAWRVFDAYVNGIFSMIVTDIPNQRFAQITCPPVILLPGQTAVVRARIHNRLDQPQEYGLGIMTDRFIVKSEPQEQITIPAGESEMVYWTVQAPRKGWLALAVSATSSLDVEIKEIFHTWPNSYRQACASLAISMVEGSALTIGVLFIILGAAVVITDSFAARCVSRIIVVSRNNICFYLPVRYSDDPTSPRCSRPDPGWYHLPRPE